MRLTKYEHACLTLEKDGKTLVIDPGIFTNDFVVPENIVGIVVTHEHTDHFDMSALGAIIAHNPDAIIFAHENITKQFKNTTLPSQAVSAGETVTIDPFSLEFFGGAHATIHASIPVVANLGVMVDELVYYPGDSFTLPDQPVGVLALPVSAPWLKLSDAIDFLLAIKPRLAFPTHDALLSTIGSDMVDSMLSGFAASYGGGYQRIKTSIEL